MSKTLYTVDALLDTNDQGIELIKGWEKFMPDWYLCPAKIWTIGYGLTERAIPNINRHTTPGPITESYATKLLVGSLITIYEPVVERHVKVPLTSNQFSALVSFVYNVGSSAFVKSTLLKHLNNNDMTAAAGQFDRWVRAGGKVLKGLVNRREAEKVLFTTPDNDPESERFARLLAAAEAMPVQKIEPLPLRHLPLNVKPPTRLNM